MAVKMKREREREREYCCDISLMPQGRVEPLNRVERSAAVKREPNLATDFGTTKHIGNSWKTLVDY